MEMQEPAIAYNLIGYGMVYGMSSTLRGVSRFAGLLYLPYSIVCGVLSAWRGFGRWCFRWSCANLACQAHL